MCINVWGLLFRNGNGNNLFLHTGNSEEWPNKKTNEAAKVGAGKIGIKEIQLRPLITYLQCDIVSWPSYV